MYVHWNAGAARELRKAFTLVSSAELVAMAAIIIAIQVGRRAVPVEIPGTWDPGVERVVILKPTDFSIPPPISGVELPRLPSALMPTTNDPGGIPQPVRDSQATDSTMKTQGSLGWELRNPGLENLLRDPNIVFKVEPPNVEPVEPKPNDVPEIGGYVKMSRKPTEISLPAPEYPNNCRVLGLAGTATVHLLLGFDGAVESVQVARSSGCPELDAAALRAGRKARFTPALGARGNPVRVWVAVPYTFKLE